MLKIMHVVGARPNVPKVAPIMAEMAKRPDRFEQLLVHTGQHYDYNMSQVFFEHLEMCEPDEFLNVGSGTHAVQTANVMTEFEPVVLETLPGLGIRRWRRELDPWVRVGLLEGTGSCCPC